MFYYFYFSHFPMSLLGRLREVALLGFGISIAPILFIPWFSSWILSHFLCFIIGKRAAAWGPLSVETRGTGPPPPNFRLGGPTMILAPQIWEVYNNSNLVNNEVFKNLTTKLASTKYYGILVWYHLLNLLTQLLDFLLYMIIEYSQ